MASAATDPTSTTSTPVPAATSPPSTSSGPRPRGKKRFQTEESTGEQQEADKTAEPVYNIILNDLSLAFSMDNECDLYIILNLYNFDCIVLRIGIYYKYSYICRFQVNAILYNGIVRLYSL